MRKLKLGSSDVEVSELAFGTDLIGSRIDRETSFQLLDVFREAGGTFIDTGNIYACWLPGCAGGESESTIGAWMKDRGCRGQMAVATKLGFDYPGCEGRLTAAEIERECEKSLARLGTDHLDVYYAHRDDPATPLEETMEAFARLVKAGKVRALAVFESERAEQLPDIPTTVELGFPGLTISNWYGIFTQAAVPEERRKELAEFRTERTADIGKKLREHIGDYLLAAQDSLGLDWTNLEGLARVRSLDPGLVAAWKGQLEKWRGTPIPAFRPWFAFAALGTNDFAPRARGLSVALRSTVDTNAPQNPLVAGSFADRPPGSMAEVAERYGTLILAADTAWQEAVSKATSAGMSAPTSLSDPAQEELRGLLYAPDSPITAATRDVDRFWPDGAPAVLRAGGLSTKVALPASPR